MILNNVNMIIKIINWYIIYVYGIIMNNWKLKEINYINAF